MTYYTRWYNHTLPTDNPRTFLWTGLKRFIGSLKPGSGSQPSRTPQKVQNDYDKLREEKRAELESMDLQGYVSFAKNDLDFVLVDDRIIWGPLYPIQERFLAHLAEVVGRYAAEGSTVIEFGSGDGRNLL